MLPTNPPSSPYLKGIAVAVLVAVVAWACDEPQSPSPDSRVVPSFTADGEPEAGEFEVCKVGTAATISVQIGTASPTNVSFAADECKIVASSSNQPANPVSVTVTELADPTIALQQIDVEICLTPFENDPCNITTYTNSTTNSVTEDIHKERGVLATFVNEPVVVGGEGCTPGYWKQPHHFDSWTSPYDPSDLFSAHFENAFPGLTLLDVLKQGGGGLKALGRHTVAALLNAASSGVDYDLTPTEVIDAFNDVFPGSKKDYNTLKGEFEGFNEQGCPLN